MGMTLTLLTVDGSGAYIQTSLVLNLDAGTQIQDASMIQAVLGTGSYLDPATIATTQGSGDAGGDAGDAGQGDAGQAGAGQDGDAENTYDLFRDGNGNVFAYEKMEVDGVTTYTGGVYVNAFMMDDPDGTGIDNVSSGYDFADNNYTKVSGLIYESDHIGDDDLTITVTAPGSETVVETVGITVADIDDAPVAGVVNFTAQEDGTVEIMDTQLLKDAYDPDGNPLSVSNLSLVDDSVGLISDPVVTGEGEAAVTTWTFTPTADSSGEMTLSYDISDGTLTTSTTATVHVSSVNDAPEAGVVEFSTNEDQPFTITEAQLLDGALDVENDELSVSNVMFSGPLSEGKLDYIVGQWDQETQTEGPSSWTFTPGTDFNGELSLSYDISDGEKTTPTTAKVTVNSVNDFPVVASPKLIVNESETVLVTPAVLGVSDVDDDPSAVMIRVSDVTNGKFVHVDAMTVAVTEFSLADVQDGKFKFIHEGEAAPTFKVAAKDDETATFGTPLGATVTYNAYDDPPVVTAPEGTISVDEGVGQLIEGISISDVDYGGETLSVTLSSQFGDLRIGEHSGQSVTLSGTLEQINGELAGAGRRYHRDDDFTGAAEPDDGGWTGGTLTSVVESLVITNTEQDIYALTGDDGTKHYIQKDPGSTKYAEVVDGGDGTWSFAGPKINVDVAGGDSLPTKFTEGTLKATVDVTYDETGQYWARETTADIYTPMDVGGLAVYEKDIADGSVSYEYDDVLGTLTPQTMGYQVNDSEGNPTAPMSVDSLTLVKAGVTASGIGISQGAGDAGQGDAGQGDAGQGDAGQGDAGGDAGQGDAGQSGNANNLITLGDGQLTGSQAGEYLVDYDPAGGTNGSGEYALTLLTVDGNGAYSETSMVFHVDAGTQIQDATMIQAGLGTGSYLDPATIATTQGSGDAGGDAGDAGQGDAGQSGNANNLITLGDGQLTGSQAGEYLVDYDPAGGTNGSGEYALTLLTVDGNGAYSETSMVFHVDAGTQIQDATMIQAGLGTGSYLDPATIATTQGSGDAGGDAGDAGQGDAGQAGAGQDGDAENTYDLFRDGNGNVFAYEKMEVDGVTTYTGGVYVNAFMMDDPDGTGIDNVSSGYDFADNNYTKVSGLIYESDHIGDDDLTITVTAPGSETVVETVGITVADIDDAPVAGVVNFTAQEDGTVEIMDTQLLKDAYDPDGNPLSVSNLSLVDDSVGLISDPVVTGEGEAAVTTWTFTPTADSSGEMTLSYDISDGTLTTSTTATVHVSSVNDAPEAGVVEFSTNEDQPFTITEAQLLDGALDVENDELSVSNVMFSGPLSEGKLDYIVGQWDQETQTEGPSSWTFTPGTDFNGELSLSYDISDGEKTTPTTAKVTVNSVNDFPVVASPKLIVNESETVLVTPAVLGVSDVDDDPSAVMIRVSDVTNGKFVHVDAMTVAVTEFSLADVQDGKFKFIHEGEAAPTFKVAAKDDEDCDVWNAFRGDGNLQCVR